MQLRGTVMRVISLLAIARRCKQTRPPNEEKTASVCKHSKAARQTVVRQASNATTAMRRCRCGSLLAQAKRVQRCSNERECERVAPGKSDRQTAASAFAALAFS